MENRIKVVLADANENFRTMLQQTIENTGEFDVVGSAGDGAEAWKMIERERPQLVITDVILPELDGFALLDRMAKLPARPKTILVSAFYREQMVMQAMEQGAAYFIAKPCEAGSLLLCKQAAKNFHTICKKETALKRVLSNLLSAVSLLRFKAVFSCGFRVPPGSGLYQSCAAGSVCIPAGQKYCSPRPRKSCPADRKTPGLPSRCIGHRW